MKSNQNRWLKLGLFLLFMPLLGCEKVDYALPVDFRMNFGIKNDPILNGNIIIDSIGISLCSLDIQGFRERGGDVFLTRSFDSGKLFNIYPSNNTDTENLNIPHGLYNPITFSFNFKPDEDEVVLIRIEDLIEIEDLLSWYEDFEYEEDLIDLKEELGEIIGIYLDHIDPCIIVKGKFIDNSVTKNIVIVINDPIKFNILGTSGTGLREVFLDRKKINIGLLQLNPAYWFSVITPERMSTALTGLIGDEEYILLSKHINPDIYFKLFDRIEESTILLINR